MDARLAETGRIPIDLRIGVTGHRWIPVDDDRVRDVVRSALAETMRPWSAAPVEATQVGITIVSALAEGADRLVATLGLDLGARLEVVLPLPMEEYEKDFRDEASRAQFQHLLACAATVDVVETAWARDHNYRAAGLTMADRIDVLIAIYDGNPAKGTGGTAEIVDYAKSLLVPVVELRAGRSEQGVEVQPPATLPDLSNAPLTPDALDRLDHFNRIRLRSGEQAQIARDMVGHSEHGWMPYYLRADLLAVRYQARHKLSVRLLYALSALAVTAVATQLIFFKEEHELAWVEFVLLLVLVTTMYAARRNELLAKWTSARYIAERLRSAMFLSRIGATPSFALVPTAGGADEWARVDWAGRAIREVWFRTSPSDATTSSPTSTASTDALTETDWIEAEWVEPQLNYHAKSLRRWSDRQRFATITAIALFVISVIASFVHSTQLISDNLPDYAGYVSIVVPAIGAAVSGYAAQREFGRQAMRSRHVLRDLTKLQLVLKAAHTPAEVRALVGQLDALVHGDAAEWYIAANLHEPEIP